MSNEKDDLFEKAKDDTLTSTINAYQENQKDYEKNLILINTGALLLSLTFISDIVAIETVRYNMYTQDILVSSDNRVDIIFGLFQDFHYLVTEKIQYDLEL